MREWTCRECGALNVAQACESCGEDQPVAATPAVTTPNESPTERLIRRPLCEHSSTAGVMCERCEAEVQGHLAALRQRFGCRLAAPPERVTTERNSSASSLHDVVATLRRSEGKA